ncbi:uncharacterized protein SEPMUDRAFT_150067 [Sphaerulina musiva SO2202]|uniref:Uncharacterized protein n=1 Tax=Sphaerulina musiva (strain SO2202) TaxID=692275 RepID=M3BUM8_SPHMS|nr:uncharacterized protein SEPMUDRAFT_150067 [Sphaerulina musiva SO2202]EMF11039.1 hypothetical protein SEPMUDRAFT_150067 [Sphaerulina musiva SO2202]
MLLSQYVLLAAAFGSRLVTSEFINAECKTDDDCQKPCADATNPFTGVFDPHCLANNITASPPKLCDCSVTSDDGCLTFCVDMWAKDYPGSKITAARQYGPDKQECCCAGVCAGPNKADCEAFVGGDPCQV